MQDEDDILRITPVLVYFGPREFSREHDSAQRGEAWDGSKQCGI